MSTKKYEAMFIIKPDLKDEEKTAVMKSIKEQVTKHQGRVSDDQIWAERRKLAYDMFPIGGQTRFREGMYYLIHFESPTASIASLRSTLSLNESILRFMILRLEEAGQAA
jgi:small subunit ribosomal protein S6